MRRTVHRPTFRLHGTGESGRKHQAGDAVCHGTVPGGYGTASLVWLVGVKRCPGRPGQFRRVVRRSTPCIDWSFAWPGRSPTDNPSRQPVRRRCCGNQSFHCRNWRAFRIDRGETLAAAQALGYGPGAGAVWMPRMRRMARIMSCRCCAAGGSCRARARTKPMVRCTDGLTSATLTSSG